MSKVVPPSVAHGLLVNPIIMSLWETMHDSKVIIGWRRDLAKDLDTIASFPGHHLHACSI